MGGAIPKNLVLCSDGTGNSSAKAEKTNVWRMFQCVDQTSPSQLAHYDDGVGTSRNKYLAALGGAFGWGLKRNVIDLYKFVCRNYKDGDSIYGFGFSRGAFTIRMVVGLMVSQGLVQCETEEQLHRAAKAAFREYRWKNQWKWHHLLLPARYVLGLLLAVKDALIGDRYKDIPRIGPVQVRFLGLWDTVAAYEMPIAEIKRAMDFWLWPMSFGDLKLSPQVQEACHALALDEERETFHPMIWDEQAEAAMVAAGTVPAGRLTQVWFAGVHSNVGGGYDEDQLSYVPFGWIADRARAAGLVLDMPAVVAIKALSSPFARLYDSRAGVAAFYRYSPRLLEKTTPTVNWSAVLRMGEGSDAYAPISLPNEFRILAPDGTLVTFADAVHLTRDPNPQMKELGCAILPLGVPSRHQIDGIWDLVWWRRVVYFATMLLASVLVAYPLLAEWISVGARADALSRGIVEMVVDAGSALIPEYLSPWLEAILERPLAFGAIAAAFLYMLHLGQFLRRRIEDRAARAWQSAPGMVPMYARHELIAVWWLSALSVVALLMLLSSFLFAWKPQARVLWALALGILVVTTASRYNQKRKLASVATTGAPTGRTSLSLAIAHFFRTWEPARLASCVFTRVVVPAVFLLLMAWAFLSVANKALVEISTSVEAGCHDVAGPVTPTAAWQSAKTPFSTDLACWPSGFVLEKGARYQVKMEMGDDWFDAGERTDLGGLPTRGWRHLLGVGLKRWWRANWLQPIARVGTIGNDEYVLDSVVPYAEHGYHQSVQEIDHCQPLTPEAAAQAAQNEPTPAERRTLGAELTARAPGQLFIYANDAAVAFTSNECFRKNNRGSATVSVRRIIGADLTR